MSRRLRVLAAAVLVAGTIGAAACSGGGSAFDPVGRPDAASEGGPTPGAEGGSDSGTDSPPAPSAGCNGGAPKEATKGLSTGLSLDVAGTDRSYDLSVPAAYDPTHAYPIVFVFHGGDGTSQNARETFSFESFAGDKAFFVYPQGLGDWDLDTPADDNHDVAFFDAMLTKLEGELCVDATRVFATGLSNGAYFSNQLGCRRGAELRAIASHAGGGPYENDGSYDENGNLLCSGGTPPAVLLVHGEADDVVAISEGRGSRKHWKWANHCSNDTTAYPPDPCVAYGGCAAPVVWCQIPGLGHALWEKGALATWNFFASF
jgi:polyhydroxybutyrate depolymerase